MRSVIAAGHPATAEAGAEILAEGGNAADAELDSTTTCGSLRSTGSPDGSIEGSDSILPTT